MTFEISYSVSALYVHPRGPYPQLVADWYDEKRDARNYQGTHPVVAHPPCGPWGRYAHKCKQDRGAALHAIDTVFEYGGVLEHPVTSQIWKLMTLTEKLPSDCMLVDLCQYQWGHRAIKPTRLLVCCKSPHQSIIEQILSCPPFPDAVRPKGGRHTSELEKMSKIQRCLTPPLLAHTLVRVASLCGASSAIKEV